MNIRDNLNFLRNVERKEERRSVRAAFRMSGAKTRLLPQLMPVLESYPHDMWVDHCGGTGVVSWNKLPCKRMIYNDRYSAVADFYLCLRDDPTRLEKVLRTMHPRCRQIWEDCSVGWNRETDPYKRSAMWYYMAVNSVAGKRGHYGMDVDQKHNYVGAGLDSWGPLRTILRRFDIENLDVKDALRTFDRPKTLHYVDPPYVGTDQETFESKWDMERLKQLVDIFHELEGTVCLSHCPNAWLDAQEWHDVHEWTIHSSVSQEDKKKKMRENLYVWKG